MLVKAQKVLARSREYFLLPSLQSRSLVCLTSPSEHRSLDICNTVASAEGLVQRSDTSEITKFFPFQCRLQWRYSSFYYNKCSTEAARSFHVVSKLPVCTLQSNSAGSASPLFSRSLVSTPWPWPSLAVSSQLSLRDACWSTGNTPCKRNIKYVQSFVRKWLPANLTPQGKQATQVPVEAWWEKGIVSRFTLLALVVLLVSSFASKPVPPKGKRGCGHTRGWEGKVQMWACSSPLCRDGVIRDHSIGLISPQSGCILIFFFFFSFIQFGWFVFLNLQQQRLNVRSPPFSPLLFHLFGIHFWRELLLQKPSTLCASELQVPFWWHLPSLGFSYCQTPSGCKKWVKRFY